jgi:ATP-binding protein involved in chromosome partitioning
VNLALRLAKCGGRVGSLDGDIYGPERSNDARTERQLTTDGKQIVPAEKYGVQVVSIGFPDAGRCADHLEGADAHRRHSAVFSRGRLADLDY